MIAKDKILALFRRMLDEHWAYVWGKADEGTVDCSGAFVWAYRQAGASVYHGSNRMARVETPQLLPIGQARPGLIAYKARDPTETGYALPDAYKPGGKQYNGDLRDYYHVGLIDEDTRYVLNARSPADGFVRSPITQGWSVVGYGKQIDYGDDKGDETMAQTATVTATSGSTVNLRAKPAANGALVERVPVGATVTVVSKADGWAAVDYQGRKGYMMAQFLAMGGEDEDVSTDNDLAAAWEAIRKLQERVQALEGGVG